VTSKNAILTGFILLKLVIHQFLIAPGYDLQRDEYLHLDQANHLAWGFESLPPFTSWISYLISLGGSPVWLVKFFPALFGALTLVVVWKTIEMLKGNLFALTLGATAITLSVLVRINILYQPNSFDILCWTTLYYCLARYFQNENYRWLYFSAIVFSLGFLNKYNIIFLLAGLGPALLFAPYNKLFRNRHFYLAMFVTIVLISPNLYWQFRNNFPVLHHMKELSTTQLINVKRADFIKEQFLFFTGSIYILIAAFAGFFLYLPFKKYRIFLLSYLITIGIFIYFKAKGYYAIGLYPIFIAFGSVYLEYLLRQKPAFYLRPLLFIITIGLFIPFLLFVMPVYTPAQTAKRASVYKKIGMLRWEDGKEHNLPQDFADMLGWKELANKVDSIYALMPDLKHTLILCDNYGQAGAINYYTKKNIKAVSMNADYINWFDFSIPYKHVILVKERDDSTREKEKKIFDSVFLAGKVENDWAREKGTCVFVLINARISVNELLHQEIRDRKNKRIN